MKMPEGRPIPVDQEVRVRAVTDLDSTLCMEAGAGTGKTTILVDRYISLIKTGRASCSQIVAITFTEKAAGEMNLRLREEIDKLIRSEETGSLEISRLRAAKENLESAPVSTIHAFASSVLREYPVESGVDPDFIQIDEIEKRLFLEDCWDEFLIQTASSRDLLIRSWVFAGGEISKLHDLAFFLYSSRGDRVLSGMFGDESGGEKGCRSGGVTGEISEQFADYVGKSSAELEELVRMHCNDPEDKGAVEVKRFLKDLAPTGGLSGRQLEEYLLYIKMPRKNAGSARNWDTRESCGRLKEIFRDLADMQSEARKSYLDRVRDSLEDWLGEFVDFADARKQKESLLDFDDLLIYTRKLLDDNAARESLRERYRYILVDEFQDTDPLQAEIIILLASEGKSPGGLELQDGKLFIVGDPKQSIYRFRKADVEIYEKIKRSLPSRGARLNICQNFRSVPGIVRWVNQVFSNIIKPPSEGLYQPEYEPIEAVRDETEDPVISLELESAGGKKDQIREIEGETVARFIRMLVDSGRMITDPADGSKRKVRYGDIALLYGAMTGISYYEDPLRDAGIPYLVEGGILYYTRQEIRDLAAAVWAVEDPFDTLALVTVLRSAIFGFSDEELFLYKRGGGKFDYLDPSLPSGPRFEDLSAAFELLRKLHEQRNERGPAGIFCDLLNGTRYLELSMLRTHGEQRVINIKKAVQIARSFGEKGHSFRSFARWFKDQGKTGAAEGESPSIDENEDAVKLITIHKSKGLQFPVVIIVNLVQAKNRSVSQLVSGGRYLSIRFSDGWETSDFARLQEIDRLKEDAQSARLLYVAATRARDILVLPKTPGNNSYYSIIEKYMENGEDGDIEGLPDTAFFEVQKLMGSEIPPVRSSSSVSAGPKDAGKKRRRSRSDLKAEWSVRKDSAIASGAGTRVYITPSGLVDHAFAVAADRSSGEDRAEDPLAFGSAFHRIMELAGLSGETDIGMLSERVASSFGIRDSACRLADLADKAISSDLMQSAREADTVLREVPFTFSFCREGKFAGDLSSGITDFVDGRIDLLFRKNEKWTIVDYKTDDIGADLVDKRFERYSVQGSVYALAAKKAGMDLSGGVIFYFAVPGEFRRLEITGRLLMDAENILQSSARAYGESVDL
ncbi:MAG: UvrD-helicase domain-containing protein [Candidatus Krumholzibacteriota bacterium]|nr:UvrD-helicase domain-containing protein [Candidatus Krumholzibacteriota bacterium]